MKELLLFQHDKMDPTFSSVLDNFNYFFTAVFTVEFILKLSAFSFRVSSMFEKGRWGESELEF